MERWKIPTILGLVILLLGVFAGVYLVGNSQIFKIGADETAAPRNVKISNISDNSFTITWTTDKATLGFVKWGESDSSLSSIETDETNSKSFTHTVTIRGLLASTKYFFVINSDGTDFLNNSIPWEASTGGALNLLDDLIYVSGSVVSPTGEPIPSAIVHATIGGATTMSTITSVNGGWIIPLSHIRKNNLNEYYEISSKDILEIIVFASENGTSSAQALAAKANPLPPMVISKTHDFRNINLKNSDDKPVAQLDLPESESNKDSKLNVSDQALPKETEIVTLESIEEGEVVNSTKPEFFGDGPTGTEINITLESDPVTASTKTTSSGWSWTPPSNLEPGLHTITISWRDGNGILKSIKRTFTVLAADDNPAFESTPSATLSPTITPRPTTSSTPTSTPRPTPTPSLTPKPSASATPKLTVTPTPKSTLASSQTAQPIPDSGNLTPTLALSMMGIGLLLISSLSAFFAYKK